MIGSGQSEVVLRPPSSTPLAVLTGFWRHRSLVAFFGRRFLDRRYSRTKLGWLWIPLRPAFDVGARVLLFGGFLAVSSGDRPYFVFFIVGMSAWILFERTASWATRAIEMNRTLLDRVHVSRLTAIVAAAVPGILDFLIYFAIGILGFLYYRYVEGSMYLIVTAQSVIALVGALWLVLAGIGIGLWTAAAAAEARDVRFISRYVLGFWFFLTPVIYPLSGIPEKYRFLAELNPVTAPVEMVKAGLLDTARPTSSSVMASLVFMAVLLCGGILLFGRLERSHAERL